MIFCKLRIVRLYKCYQSIVRGILTMKLLVVLFALAAFAGAETEPLAVDNNTAYGYLKNIGIPEAERILKAEEALLSGSRIVGGLPAGPGQYSYQVRF